jgi:Glycosyl hydrolase family 65 central catalytic domain
MIGWSPLEQGLLSTGDGKERQSHRIGPQNAVTNAIRQRTPKGTPEITRSLLMYRYRRLDEARAAAARAGYRGATFPWQSGSDGQEETQEQNYNSRSKRWIKDNSYLQRHVGSAIAFNVWQYFQVTQDLEFL